MFTYYPHAPALSTCSPDHIEAMRAARIDLFLGKPSVRRGRLRRLLRETLWPLAVRSIDKFIFSKQVRVTCNLVTLSEFIRSANLETVDLLKIDVENSEWDVLDGIQEADWGKIRQVVVEVHDIDGRMEGVTQLLQEHRFVVEVDQDEWYRGFGIFNVYAIRSA